MTMGCFLKREIATPSAEQKARNDKGEGNALHPVREACDDGEEKKFFLASAIIFLLSQEKEG
jgi:hypothetical protein